MAGLNRELWGLRINEGSGAFLRASGDFAGDPLLVYESEAQAIAGAKWQHDRYDIECEPVRLISGDDSLRAAIELAVKNLRSWIEMVKKCTDLSGLPIERLPYPWVQDQADSLERALGG